MDYSLLASVAETAAGKASHIHRQFQRSGFAVESKGRDHDFVTEADKEAELAVVGAIQEAFPEHGIVGEEGNNVDGSSQFVWYIDPLDGTTNYVHGLPYTAVSICCVEAATVVAAVVQTSAGDQTFSASRGAGATLNGTPIHVSDRTKLEDSLLITGFFYDRADRMVANLGAIRRCFEHGCRGVRRFGSAALDLCHVAAGCAEGFWENYLAPWDYGAGMLMVEEAGGLVTDQNGVTPTFSPSFVVAGNHHVQEALRKLVRPRDE